MGPHDGLPRRRHTRAERPVRLGGPTAETPIVVRRPRPVAARCLPA